MGLRLKVMPGLRIGVSTRGLRVSGGPRVARVHMGAGKTRVSSSLGPFSGSTRLMPKKGRRSPSGRTQQPTAPTPMFTEQDAATAASLEAAAKIGASGVSAMSSLGTRAIDAVRRQRALAAMGKEQSRAEARRAVDEFEAQMLSMATAHHETFPAAQPAEIDDESIRVTFTAEALRDSSALRPSRRRDKIAQAQQQADVAIASAHATGEAEWHGLLRNDPATVIAVLDAVFEDNQAPAIAVDCEGDHVTLVVTLAAAVPEMRPTITHRGKLESKPWAKGDAATFYATVAASAILATVKETWASCPSIARCTVVALRNQEQLGISGLTMTEVLYRGTFTRNAHRRLAWTHVDPVKEIRAAEEVAFERRGRHKEVQPLSLEKHPDLGELLQDLEAAMSGEPGAPAGYPDMAPEQLPLDHSPGAKPPMAPPAGQETTGAPGWYPDPWTTGPQGATGLRWWDGSAWSVHAHPAR